MAKDDISSKTPRATRGVKKSSKRSAKPVKHSGEEIYQAIRVDQTHTSYPIDPRLEEHDKTNSEETRAKDAACGSVVGQQAKGLEGYHLQSAFPRSALNRPCPPNALRQSNPFRDNEHAADTGSRHIEPATLGPTQDAPCPPYAFIQPNPFRNNNQPNLPAYQDFSDAVQAAANAAFVGVGADAHPPLPTTNNQAWSGMVHSFSANSQTTGLENDMNIVAQGQHPTSASATRSHYILRAVPHVADALQKLSDGRQVYENDARNSDGNYRSLLHHIIMIETRHPSHIARKLVHQRVEQAFTAIKTEIDSKLQLADRNWYQDRDRPDAALDVRLQTLLFHTLLNQAIPAGSSVGMADYVNDCFLESRKWTMEKLEEMREGVRRQIKENNHLKNGRHRHLQVPN